MNKFITCLTKRFSGVTGVFLIALLAVSCGNNSTGPDHKKQGILKVITQTKNAGKQTQNYSIVFSIDEHKPSDIGVNDTIYIKHLDSGFYNIKLKGVNSACTVSGDNPRGASITAGDTTSVTFTVDCGSEYVAGIKSVINDAIDNHAFSGAAVVMGHDTTVYMNAYGHYKYQSSSPEVTLNSRFDLASLTKVIATTTSVMLLYDQNKISLDQKVSHYLPDFAQNGKENVTVRELLTHSSGLKPDINPYNSSGGLKTRKEVINDILAQSLTYTPGSKSVYSDLNFITLMLVVNEITGVPFDKFCEKNIFKPLGMNNTGFMKKEKYKGSSKFVPTATNLQGVVNDPTSRAMGGVAGHAGLFTTAKDIAKFAEMFNQNGRANGKQFLKASTIKLFTTRSNVPNSNRALGWKARPPKDQFCSCGRYFSSASFGHRGYTGTDIWFDPKQKLFGVLLVNGTYPSGSDDVSTIAPARQNFYNQLYKSIINK